MALLEALLRHRRSSPVTLGNRIRSPQSRIECGLVKAGLYVEKPDPKHPRKPGRFAIRFHDLRHCMGTVLAEAGVEQRLIQELLGQSGIRISERHTKPHRPALRRAALKATRLMGVDPLPSV